MSCTQSHCGKRARQKICNERIAADTIEMDRNDRKEFQEANVSGDGHKSRTKRRMVWVSQMILGDA